MAYKSVVLEDSVTINRIISVHYFQYMSDFSFPGESHDFWELVCVDRGEIDALAGDRRLTLKKGNILFHKPNEFHNVLTNGKVSPSLVVIGFECHSPAIKSFEDQLMSVQDTEKSSWPRSSWRPETHSAEDWMTLTRRSLSLTANP